MMIQNNDPKNTQAAQTSDERLSEMLLNLIVKCMEEGVKLPTEKQMTSDFAVSRLKLRDALGVFEKEGIITTIQGSGRYVAEPNLCDRLTKSIYFVLQLQPNLVFDLIEARKLLEIATYPIVLERITSVQLQQLSKYVFSMLAKGERGESFEDDDRAFHKVIYDSCGNYVVQQLLMSFDNLLMMTPYNKQHSDLLLVAKQHERLLEALAREDIQQLTRISKELAADFRYQITIATTKPEKTGD